MAKIIFVNRFFYPDQSATSQILSDLAFALGGDCHDVHVIASRNLIAGPPQHILREEKTRDVAIHRVGSMSMQTPNLLTRLFNYLTFYWWAAFQLRKYATEDCIVVVKTDPPLISVWARCLLRNRRVQIINWLQDVYPEVAIRVDVRFVGGRLGRILSGLRDRSLQSAAANVVLGSRMADYLASRNVSPTLTHVIPNWVDDEAIRPVGRHLNPLRLKWGLAARFVVGYSGNLGRVHEFETVLGAAERFKGRRDVCLLFIGGGFQYARLKEELRRRGLEDLALFMPYHDQNELSNSLGVPDVHWVSLLPEFEGLIVPSKFYGIAAAGRATLAITDADGEIARLVDRHKCGAVIIPGDGEGLANLLELMIANPGLGDDWGRNARAMIEIHYSRRLAIAKWRDLIASLDPEFNKPPIPNPSLDLSS